MTDQTKTDNELIKELQNEINRLKALQVSITAEPDLIKNEKLAESELHFQSLPNNAPVGIFRTRADGNTTYVNPRWCELSGLDADKALGDGWLAAVHPDDRVMLASGWHNASSHSQTSATEYRFLRADSTIVSVMGNAVPETNAKNEITGYFGTITDITERKQAERKISLFRSLIDGANDAFEVIDLKTGQFLDVNERGLLDLGYTREEFLNLYVFDIDPSFSKEQFEKTENDILTKGNNIWEGIHYRKDGTSFPVEVNRMIIELDRKYLIAVVRDITARKQAEDALYKSRNELQEYFENDISANSVISAEGEILNCNKTFVSIFGFENQAQTENFNVTQLFKNPDDRTELTRLVKQNGRVKDYEVDFKRRDGYTIHSILNIIGKFDESGELVNSRVYIVDITELKKAQQDLSRSKKNLQEKVAELSLLSETTSSLLELNTKDEIYNYAGEKIYQLSGADYMISTEYDIHNESSSVRQMFGLKHYIDKITKLIGKDILQIKIPFKDVTAQMDLALRRRIYLVEGGIYNLAVQQIPKILCIGIEKLLGVEEIFSVGFMWEGHYYGDISMGFKKGNHLKNTTLIQSIIDQTALALGKKYYEESLIESELRYRSIFENTGTSTMIVDENTTILLANEECSAVTGYTPEQLIGTNWTKYVAPDSLEQMMHNRFRRKQNPESVANRYEVHLINASGEVRYTNLSIGYIASTRHTVVSMLDITERKQAEEALHKSETLQRKMVSNIGDVIVVIDQNGINRYKSPNITQLFGWEPDELVGKSTWEVVHPDDQEYAQKFVGALATESNATGTTEIRYRRKDGKYVWIEITLVNLLSDPDILGVLGNYHDITERKQAENLLKESEQKSMSIMENSADAIFLTNQQGKYVYTNKAVTAMLGFTSAEMLNMTIEDISPPNKIEEYFEIFKHVLKEGKIFCELELLKKDGNYISTDLNAVLLPDGIIYASCRDITERKKAESELNRAKEHAEESDRLKSAFLLNLSHEIRTPMNGILGFAELLKMPGISIDEQQEYISYIKISSDRMLNIISDLVDISKIESGLVKVDYNQSNINEQTEFVYTSLKLQAEAKGLNLSYSNDIPDGEAIITTDRKKVDSILSKLVKNAIKYTDHGSIEFGYNLKSAVPSSGRAVVSSSNSEAATDVLAFYIKDTGIGIPVDRQQAIFERFVQADIEDKRAYQGAGLGLSIAKGYVEMLGGNIWVKSEEGKGSTFHFTIPYLPVQKVKIADSILTSPVVATEQIKKLKILVVEDDDTSVILLMLMFKKYSRETLIADTGTEAIEICRNNSDIDLVLMDIKMSGMDGYEATRQIRLFNKDVVIIAQTAFTRVGDKEKALEAGCNHYVSKPIRKDELMGLIQKYFR